MILIDVNLLIYAYEETSPFHRAARLWVESAFSGATPVHLSWVGVLAFIRITTSRSVPAPRTIEQALAIVSLWMSVPAVTTLQAGERHWEILSSLLRNVRARGALVMDAHLAALAIEHGATLYTNDREFARFPGLKVEFPLQ